MTMTMEYVKENTPTANSKCPCWPKGILLFLAVVIAAFVIIWLNSPLIVTVTGTGEVSVPATYASVSLTVAATDANPNGAINQVKSKIESLRRVLQSSGISDSDIIESQITAVPLAVTAGSGYQASMSLGAKTSNVSAINDLISNLYANGATVVSQPVLSADEQDELEAQALNEAMQNAKEEAAKIARKQFKLIKKIVAVTQASSGTSATVTSKATEGMGDEFKIIKAVQVSYKMW